MLVLDYAVPARCLVTAQRASIVGFNSSVLYVDMQQLLDPSCMMRKADDICGENIPPSRFRWRAWRPGCATGVIPRANAQPIMALHFSQCARLKAIVKAARMSHPF